MAADDSLLSPEEIQRQLLKYEPTMRNRIIEKVILAALGVIPWVGGFLSAAASLKTEEPNVRSQSLQNKWLAEHETKLRKLLEALAEMGARFQSFGDQIEERVNSEEYLELIRKGFRTWDEADTDEKKKYVTNMLTNAAGTRLTTDDVIRLFIDWLRLYHEAHFAVIRKVFQEPGVTRYDIWKELKGEFPREDSADADLYKLLIRDLNIGGVIRQARDTTEDGQFLKRRPKPSRVRSSSTMESAFEDSKPYVLTELGKQFVHYTMNEVVTRIDQTPQDADVSQ
jgi:hypothetical protein